MTPAEALRIARVGNLQVNQLRAAAGQQAAKVWQLVGNVDDAAARAFVDRMLPLSAQLEAQAAEVMRAYLSAYAERLATVDVAAALATRHTPAAEVWRRPVIVARAALAEGKQWTQAMAMAQHRAVSLAETNVALAARSAGQQAMVSVGAVGYRRVPDGRACQLCLIAATQRYHLEQLMPIHDRCGCTVAPIIGSKDLGHVIDREALDRLKLSGVDRRITEQRRNAPLTDGIAVHEHGELGPVLTPAGHAFTGETAALAA